MEKDQYMEQAYMDEQPRPEDTFMSPSYYNLAESPEDSKKKMYSMKTLARYMEHQDTNKQEQARERRGRPSSPGCE